MGGQSRIQAEERICIDQAARHARTHQCQGERVLRREDAAAAVHACTAACEAEARTLTFVAPLRDARDRDRVAHLDLAEEIGEI